MNVELLDKALASALCPMFQAIIPATSTIAVVAPFLGPKGMAASVVAANVANLSMLGASATCSEVEIGPDPTPLPGPGCQEVSEQGDLWYRYTVTGDITPGYSKPVKRIISVDPVENPGNEAVPVSSICTFELPSGEIETTGASAIPFNDIQWFLVPREGSTCVDPGPDGPIENPTVPDHIYVDQSTNCSYTVKFEGFIRQTEDGPIQPVFQISGGQETRAPGGRMGGCFLNPVIHVSPPNGPGGPDGPPIPPIPVPPVPPPGPGGGVPWWAGPVLGGATNAALQLIGDAIAEATRPALPAGEFSLVAPCDFDSQGNRLEQVWKYPKQKADERMIAHQITILEALQTHLNWKTPICGNEKPPLEGQWVTTRWESVEKMAHSGRRLRKLFRYRTKSTRNVGQLSAYWEAFTWEAGDVIVWHEGAWWGTPKIWAASQEEGERVIRFAAAEAGLNPDQDGQWRTSSSRSPRYGMSGTMKIQLLDGFPWVSSRDGEDWPNVLAKASDS